MRNILFLTVKVVCVVLVSMSLDSGAAQASDPTWSPCILVNDDGSQVEHADMSIGTVGDFDGNSYWILAGKIDVPTPSYQYEMRLGSYQPYTQKANITLMAPSGIAPMAISQIGINERYPMPNPITVLDVEIDKSFNWGVRRILCDVQP